jgi:tetratricopeptide (TPR) repeat protein
LEGNEEVFFISGTGYCGTTLLCLLLASNKKGFSGGEIQKIFRSLNESDRDPENRYCGCFDSSCNLWNEIEGQGEKQVYPEIYRRFPEVKYIFDSSLPDWFFDQLHYNREISKQCIIAYKSPGSWLNSVRKRKTTWFENIKSSPLDFYTLRYTRSIRLGLEVQGMNFVNFDQFISDPRIELKQLCSELGIKYVPDQEKFWESTHHIVFGSVSAKIHLTEQGSDEFQRLAQYLKDQRGKKKPFALRYHREIYKEESTEDTSRVNEYNSTSDHPAYRLFEIMDNYRTSQNSENWKQVLDSKFLDQLYKRQKQNPQNFYLHKAYFELLKIKTRDLSEAARMLEDTLDNEEQKRLRRGWHRILAREYETELGNREKALKHYVSAVEIIGDDDAAIGDWYHIAELGDGEVQEQAKRQLRTLKPELLKKVEFD